MLRSNKKNTRNTDSSGVEWDHVKAISAGWIYADSILGLDGRGGGAAGGRTLAGTRAKDATEYGTSNYEDSDGNTELDPVADLFLRWLRWGDITRGSIVVWVTRTVRGVSVDRRVVGSHYRRWAGGAASSKRETRKRRRRGEGLKSRKRTNKQYPADVVCHCLFCFVSSCHA